MCYNPFECSTAQVHKAWRQSGRDGKHDGLGPTERVYMMKRWMFAMAVVCMLAIGFQCARGESPTEYQLIPGAVIQLGQYEQDNKTDNGQEAIEWMVLDAQDGKALLLSKQALDCLAFNDGNLNENWESSSIRSWLNNSFFQSTFSPYEQQAILTAIVSNAADECNPSWNQVDAPGTEDRVFLLSYAELLRYFPDQNGRKTTSTEFARGKGAGAMSMFAFIIGETDWWLRSPGKVPNDAAFVDVNGAVGTKVTNTKMGVRPALWLDVSVDATGFPSAQYQQAASLSLQGDYAAAAEIYESLGDYTDSPTQAKENRYLQATLSSSQGQYETAISQFEALTGYKDSDALATKNRYLRAQQLAEQGEFDAAIALFEALDGYEDSYALGRKARYDKAVSYQEAKDYATASKLFAEVGQYEDSMARMKECFDKLGVQYSYFSDQDMKVIKTDYNKGYQNKHDIDNGDKHFGWRMGRFFISNYTRRISVNDKDNNTGNIVFLKTLGDSVTLWFDLEQNINALDGNINLIVAEDIDGYDKYFGVKQTNFGRGTLIIRHKDFRGDETDPVIYTDYLLAKGTTAADTKVILLEEGDYEVALDYELQDNDITHIFSKFDNYRIFFTFSIRNGNCMVYPFDVKTRAELQNTAITENGFYLDLARSRYLKIDVKRSVIVEGPAGMIEDERFNRPAKDGDQYTQEGIYTISVSNLYTGESTVKTIFVGSDDLLQEYIANGFNMDRLK